ncbi:hypothetical protein F5Y04DRAFT_289493 [Hypomontagnella monticulosa]|nr:hypothetical protein F5Y04DRAFT_289493 [Hypomontagnella monticulosa]
MAGQGKSEKQVTQGGKEYVDRTIKILTPAFIGDPVFTWLLHNYALSKHEKKLDQLFSAFFTQAALNEAIFLEIADFACCSVLIQPGKSVENPRTLISAGLFPALWNLGLGPFKRALFEYSNGVEPHLKKALTKAELKKHWYVFIMGTAVDRRRQGHASGLLVHIQDRARKDGCPIWLEATTDTSRRLYQKHGFEVIGDIILGKGKVGSDGLPKKHGEGITIWSMLWRP